MTHTEGRRFWMERVRAQRASGRSATAYCREHGIKVRTFWRWARRLGTRVAAERMPGPVALTRFARVELAGPVEVPRVLVRFPGGVVVESPGGLPDPRWISAVVTGLVGGECR